MPCDLCGPSPPPPFPLSHFPIQFPPYTQTKEALAKKLNRPDIARMDLTPYERLIADEVLDPDQLEGGFDTIGGLEQQKREIFAGGSSDDSHSQPWETKSIMRVDWNADGLPKASFEAAAPKKQSDLLRARMRQLPWEKPKITIWRLSQSQSC